MESFWPEELSGIKAFETPKNILEEQGEYLLKLTKGMIYSSVEEENLNVFDIEGIEFCYNYNIRGKFLDGYRFNIMTLGHGINIYPLYIILDEDIANEMEIIDNWEIQINGEDEFTKFLSGVFSAKKINNVLRSILSLSK